MCGGGLPGSRWLEGQGEGRGRLAAVAGGQAVGSDHQLAELSPQSSSLSCPAQSLTTEWWALVATGPSWLSGGCQGWDTTLTMLPSQTTHVLYRLKHNAHLGQPYRDPDMDLSSASSALLGPLVCV